MNLKKLLFLFIFSLILLIISLTLKPSMLQNFGTKHSQTDNFPTPIPTQKNEKTNVKWGVYAGDGVNQAIDLDQKLGNRQSDFYPVFIHWGNENQLPSQVAEYAALENQTIVIYWEAMDYNVSDPSTDSSYSYDQILSGTYDDYLTKFAASLKKYGRPIILVPFEEMNGDWYPWSITKNGNTPQKHIATYRYLHKFFNGVSNVKFAWSINNDSSPDTPQNQPSNYYPGANYVDYVAVDGFNFDDPWQNFNDVFSSSLSYLHTLNKPILILSMASAPGSQKAQWIKDAATTITADKKIYGWIWFNENKERDWRIWSDNNSLKAFQQSLLTASR